MPGEAALFEKLCAALLSHFELDCMAQHVCLHGSTPPAAQQPTPLVERRTWTLISSVSTCWSLGYVNGATPSTSLPAGAEVVSSVAPPLSTLTPGTCMTAGPAYSIPSAATAAACMAICVADTNCAAW